MPNPVENKHILLGITGSIAAYKAVDLASRLTKAGALVDVVLTPSAEKFVTPLTFSSVTGRPAYTDPDLWGGQGHVLHIGLGRAAELIVIAPASASTLSKLAHGMADNLLNVTVLASNCPVIVAPAMDAGMFSHAATQSNLQILQQRGIIIIGPDEGHLASGLTGKGRLVENEELYGHIRRTLAQGGPLTGRKVVVTAGGTQEPIDPVRVISNRSSGKQGFALAQAAIDCGAQVALITAPTHLATPVGARRVDVLTAQEMLERTLEEVKDADILLMAAAVADFRPAAPAGQKIKKTGQVPDITLESTVDILAEVASVRSHGRFPKIVVGFAAESASLIENAQAKLQAKKLDLIVANDITARDAGFEVDTNRVTLLNANGEKETLPLLTKTEVAERVVESVIALLSQQ